MNSNIINFLIKANDELIKAKEEANARVLKDQEEINALVKANNEKNAIILKAKDEINALVLKAKDDMIKAKAEINQADYALIRDVRDELKRFRNGNSRKYNRKSLKSNNLNFY